MKMNKRMTMMRKGKTSIMNLLNVCEYKHFIKIYSFQQIQVNQFVTDALDSIMTEPFLGLRGGND